MLNQAVGNGGILVALIFSAIVTVQAARRQSATSRAWFLMALSWFLAALAQVLYTVLASSGSPPGPSPVLATVSYLAYSVPVVAALFAFPKPPALLISRFRAVLDAVVITIGLVFLSEATVLHSVREVGDLHTFAGWSGLAYPIADLAICSVVFTLGMRQPPTNRLTWLCLGSGLVILAVTDSIYVRLMAGGRTHLTGSPLVIGWMAAPVLTALAALLPRRAPKAHVRNLTLAAQLIPYVPVWGAIVVLATVRIGRDSFLLGCGIMLLLAVTVRQVMIVYENVSLTRDLEGKVAARTAELATMGSIVTSSGDAVVGVSSENIITAWNPAAERLYGYPASEVVGHPPDVLSPNASETAMRLLQRANRGEVLGAYETDWTRRDGSVVPVALRVSPIHDGDKVRGISVFGQDITERRRSASALEDAREEALQSSQLKSEFLATMSHEIRTPMNGVIGLSTLLLKGDLNDLQRQYAQGVLSAGEALLTVINDILDFSKLEAGKVVIDAADFDLPRLVEDVGALLAPAAFAKHLELVAYCQPEVPRMVHGDAGRIRQVLLNLASNAVKFTGRGEVAVKVGHVPLGDGRLKLRFEVVDTGIGIAEDDRDRLFDSFSQADSTTTRRFGGTGLGLAICRRLVEVMAGEIGLESQLGVGSMFWFEIPLEIGTGADATTELQSVDFLGDVRILVVDDSVINREILQAQLVSWHMRPVMVADASTALLRLKAAASERRPYQLVVLDMAMPDMDGLQLASAITADFELKGTPMIMLTSSLQLDPAILRQAGIEQWLTKPVRSSELYDKVMRLFIVTQTEVNVMPGPQERISGPQVPLGRVLVAEDNPPNKLVAEGLLTALGYEAHIVDNGQEALDALQSNLYLAVLMDCHMPVMDGFAATAEIRRRHTNGSRIPIIAMTAGALAEDRERCLAAGMDDYLSKPVQLRDLETTLARWARLTPPASAVDQQRSSVGRPPNGDGNPERAIDQSRLVDLRELKTRDGSSLLASIIQSFLDHSPHVLQTLREVAQTGSDDRLAAVAHEMTGTAGTVGAKRVATLCKAIDVAARETGSRPSAELLMKVEMELERAHEALAQLLVTMS